jgi:hypothetical protein
MKLTSQPLGIIKIVFEHKYCILYFQIAFSNLYKAASASDKCTLYSDRNLINRRNVKSDVSSAVNACRAFFQLEVEARVVAGGLLVLGIGNLDGEPEEKIFMGNEDSDSEKKTYLREIATQVVDRFVVNFNCINTYLSKIPRTFHLLSQIRLQYIDI